MGARSGTRGLNYVDSDGSRNGPRRSLQRDSLPSEYQYWRVIVSEKEPAAFALAALGLKQRPTRTD